ncbi:hypothetical protein [Gordonia sp. (in: high G+C Gram-positive bacteria)]|uniref:hypothetical protein n=1 Tax=Gordonia sp. (in: high G+C Gram-positive bacteria) TaxID=84139 RepID=UPI00261A1A47|nr:hypothetical protein [Gordonia sp. (in: high G+C Gram-positive bacteria)]
MTGNTTEINATEVTSETSAAEPDVSLQTSTPETEGGEPEPQSKREARYRTQLRDAEAQRDQLAERVETMQRTEVERLAADVIAAPKALWAAGVTLDDLLDDDGMVDAAKVEAATRTAQKELSLELGGTARKLRGPYVPKEGTSLHRPTPTGSWRAAFE